MTEILIILGDWYRQLDLLRTVCRRQQQKDFRKDEFLPV